MIFHLQQPILWPHQIQASVRWEKLQNQPSLWCWRSRRSEWSQLRRCSSSRVHRTVLDHQTAPSGRDTLSWARRGCLLLAEAVNTREETMRRASSSRFLHAVLICLTLLFYATIIWCNLAVVSMLLWKRRNPSGSYYRGRPRPGSAHVHSHIKTA